LCDVLLNEYERGSPRRPLTSEHTARGEEQSWANRPHEELVRAFRGLIWKERQALGKDAWRVPPANIVGDALLTQSNHYHHLDEQRSAYYRQIYNAWAVIAYDYYHGGREGKPSNPQYDVGHLLSGYYQRAKRHQEPRPEIIKLDPLQVKVLDALAEAADIPHERRQTEIEIPEPFRSDEWYHQLAKHRQR
jgi:hypothetical protein